MPVSKTATTNRRSDANKTVILNDNIATKKPNINILASKTTIAGKKTDANIQASKAAMGSKKSDTNKTLKKTNANKAANDLD